MAIRLDEARLRLLKIVDTQNTVKIYPNTVSSYGGLAVEGYTKGGYQGIHLGSSTNYMTVMSGEDNQGLYNQATGRWLIYYKRTSDAIGIGTSDLVANNRVTITNNASITNLLTVGFGTTHYGIKVGNTYINAISGDLILQNNNAIRFGADDWDYNKWAGLKYNPTNKYIYLGIADGTIFSANSSQSGGRILTPGVGHFHVGNQTNYYFASNGDIVSNTLKVGIAADQATSPGVGIQVHDLRNATPLPGMFGDRQVNFYFDQITDNYGGSSGTKWMSIMHMKGWNGSYSAWELAGNADNSSSQDTLRYRQGIDSTWGDWQSILTDANFTTYLDGTYVNASGDTMTGTLILAKTQDASGTANNKPALIVGGTDTQAHIEIDSNEVMAKTNGTSVAELHLNADGGKVNIGNGGLYVGTGGITTSGDILATTTATTDRTIRATNANGSVSIHTSTNRGLYDHTRSAWIIYSRASDNTTRIPQHLYTDNGYITSSTTMYLSSASSTSLIFRKGTTAHARFDTSGHFIPETTATYNLGGTEKLWNTIHGHHLQLLGTTDATMTAASTNPRITFAEGTGSQPVHLIYTDYDSYRSPAGLKVIGGTSATPAWFEVEGNSYAGGLVYIKNAYPAMAMQSDGTYWGMGTPDAGFSDWIRTTVNGIIPYSSDGTNGKSSLGTSSWPFSAVYAKALKGNADTASKWLNARTITIGKDYAGSVSIDGSANKTLDITAYKSTAGGNNTNTYPWRRIAYISNASSSYSDYDCILDIRATYDNTRFGRIKISYRTNNASTGAEISCHARWIYRSGFNLNDLVIASWGASGQACYADIFLNCGGSWPRLEINQVYGERKWTLVTSSEATDAASRTEAYSTVAAAGTELHSKAYTGTWNSEDAPTVVNYSHSTGSVAWASITGKPSTFSPSSHTHNYLPLTGGTISGNVSFSAAASGTSPLAQRISINGVSGDTSVANAPGIGFHTGNVGWGSIKCVGSSFYFYNSDCSGYVPIYGSKVYGAVWNDYAEYRNQFENISDGRVAYCKNDGKLRITTERLQRFEGVVSDTFGFAIGETDNAKTPLAVSGRVLVYTYEPRDTFNSGDCVCAAPNGTVSKMTREEIVTYPDRIVGIVSEIPDYEIWGTGEVPVNGRIWIKVK